MGEQPAAQQEPDVVIELRGVTFAYEPVDAGNQPILADINLRIRRGEFVGIIGGTGSGKSTLLHLMAGIIPHYTRGHFTGEVLIDGVNTRDLTLAQITSRVGVVTQDPENQLFNLLVKDEVVWALENRGYARELMEQRLGETLELFNISHLRDRITYDLSGGEKQRVALASTYVFRPEVLILDNPTSQLDPVGSRSVIESVRRLVEQGQTIVMVEDKIDELLEQADRLIFLHRGRVVLDVAPEELADHLDLLHEIGVRPPEVLELSRRLQDLGVPLERTPMSVTDAVHVYQGLLRQPPGHPVAGSRDGEEVPQGREVRLPAGGAPQNDGLVPHLVVRDLVFRYPPPRTIAALQGVNLRIRRGSFVAIIGRNGSGKTTLARCMSGYLTPAAGEVTIGGQAVHRLPLRQRVRRVGYVFQNPDHQIFKDPVQTDVEFGPRNLGWPEDVVARRATAVLEHLGLSDVAHVHPYTLSKGDRQRLAIAAIAVMEPEVLIVDEPTTGQDAVHAHEIMRLLDSLRREKGMTIVVITHAMNLLGEYCDHVVAMHEGRVLIEGAPAEVFAHPEVLAKTAVVPPPVTELALMLGAGTVPLTLDEAVRVMASRALLQAGEGQR